MKTVDEREFRTHAAEYLAGDEVLTIERDGRPLGTYVPHRAERPKRLELPRVADDPERQRIAQEALARLEATLARVMDETGYTEEEMARLWDPRVPESELPEAPKRRRGVLVGGTGS